MYQKFFNRRFQRNTKLLSPPSIDLANRNYSASKEFTSTSNCENREDQKLMMNKDLTRQLNMQILVERIMMIEDAIQSQRSERLSDTNKLTAMVKDMQCKHSAIIYDSQIKYCKSPPKMDTVSSFKGQKEHTLKKVSSSSYFVDKNTNNRNSAKTSQRINTNQSAYKNNLTPKASENSSKIISETDIASLTDQSLFLQKELDDSLVLEQKIKQSLNQNLTKVRQESLIAIDKKISQLAQTLFSDYDQLNQQIANIKSTKTKLQNEISALKSNVESVSHKFGELSKHNNQSLSDSLRQSTTQLENKVSQIERNFKVFEVDVQSQLSQLFDSSNLHTQQIKRMNENLKDCSLSLMEKIQTNSRTYIEKLSLFCEQKHLKQVEQRKMQNEKAQILNQQRSMDLINLSKNLEEKIINRTQILRVTSHKQLKSQCEKLQQKLVSVIEGHVGYVQTFINKIAQKQNIIMKKFLSAEDTAQSWNEDSSSVSSKQKEEKVEELRAIVKSNYEQLAVKNSQLESTMSGVIEALNSIISKVKTCV